MWIYIVTLLMINVHESKIDCPNHVVQCGINHVVELKDTTFIYSINYCQRDEALDQVEFMKDRIYLRTTAITLIKRHMYKYNTVKFDSVWNQQ